MGNIQFLDQDGKKLGIIEISPELYYDVEEIVEKCPENFSSINGFAEIAIKNLIHKIKFNIENSEEIISKDGRLIIKGKKGWCSCSLCNIYFLKDNIRDSNNFRVCPDCKEIVKEISRIIKKQEVLDVF